MLTNDPNANAGSHNRSVCVGITTLKIGGEILFPLWELYTTEISVST